MLLTVTDLTMLEANLEVCRAEGLACTAGVHPHDAKDAPVDLQARLRTAATEAAVRAIGETGLDFNRNFSPPAVQRRVFSAQLEIAAEVGLPVFVHDRDSNGEVADQLGRFRTALTGVVVHCFTGSAEDLARLLELDCYIGITGWITERKRGAVLREIIGALPLERLLIETDAPFLLPGNLPKGWHATHAPGVSTRRNEPALLPYVAAGVAEAMGVEVSAVIEASTANARRLFRL